MTRQNQIETKLNNAFTPSYILVENESRKHSVPPGSESHFKVVLVSEIFLDKGLLARHKAVNKALADELNGQIHALALHTYTAAEWQAKNANAPLSPDCHGGGKPAL